MHNTRIRNTPTINAKNFNSMPLTFERQPEIEGPIPPPRIISLACRRYANVTFEDLNVARTLSGVIAPVNWSRWERDAGTTGTFPTRDLPHFGDIRAAEGRPNTPRPLIRYERGPRKGSKVEFSI